jgi:competence protein ComGF
VIGIFNHFKEMNGDRMFFTKDHKTIDMFDHFAFLESKRRTLLDSTWAGIFRDEILTELPVELLSSTYHDIMGRPTKELYAMLGLMIIQQMEDLSDEEAARQFAFNIQWHYALNITGNSDKACYICPKTIWTMRDQLSQPVLDKSGKPLPKNGYDVVFETVADKLAKVFTVDVTKQRLDSTHIFSNMRHLGRIGLFAATIEKFLVNLKRHHKELFVSLGDEIINRYLPQKGAEVFSLVKPTESAKTLEIVAADLFSITERFTDNKAVVSMATYQLLLRVLKEQCVVIEDVDTKAKKVEVKKNKEVLSDSLQNPSDPDASYDAHKGKGYQVQIMETYSTDAENKDLILITHAKVEQAHESDAHALLPAIAATKERDLAPELILADTLYGGDDNVETAKAQGVEVIAPVMGRSSKKELSISDFTLSDAGEVAACPQGNAPNEIKTVNDKQRAFFDRETCAGCPLNEKCPVKMTKKKSWLEYDEKALRLAKRRAKEKTDEFMNNYRHRAGIEGTNSFAKRRTGLEELRVRGKTAVSFAVTMKLTGINILRASAFKNRQERAKRREAEAKSALKQLICSLADQIRVFKEQLCLNYSNYFRICEYSY